MLEALLSGKPAIFSQAPVLMLDPSNLATGSTAIADSSGKAVTVTNTGVVVANKGPKAGMKSLYFSNTANCYLRLPYAQLPNLLRGDFTIEFWYQPESLPNGVEAIIAQWAQITNKGGFLTHTGSGNRIFTWGPYSENAALNTESQDTIGVWRHTAIVRKDGVFSFFTDGTYRSGGSRPESRDQIGVDWTVGAYFGPGNGIPQSGYARLNGWIAGLRVYTAAKYTSNFTPA